MKLSLLLLGASLILAAAPRLGAEETVAPGGAPQAAAAPSPIRPGRQVSVAKVKDTFFSYVLGIIFSGIDVDIDNAQMRQILTEFQSKLKFPFDLVKRVVQEDNPDTGHRDISLIFRGGNVVIPIPYSFLGYHPGTLRSTERLNFRVIRSTYSHGMEYTPVYDLTLVDGSVLIDIDDWLVYLLSQLIDKLQVRHIIFFNYQGNWIGLIEGEGLVFKRDVREYFDFTNNRIVYPISDQLDALGRMFVKSSPPLEGK
jgi:hypothetical protein